MGRAEELSLIRRQGVYMEVGDLLELQSLLSLYEKTYSCGQEEAVALLEAVQRVLSLEYDISPENAKKRLRNPRGAGRKPTYTEAQSLEVKRLRKEGLAIRNIAEQSGIPKSTVERILKS